MHKIIYTGRTWKYSSKNISAIDVNNNLRLRSRRTNTMAKKRKAAKRKPAAKKRKASKKRA